MGSYTFNIISTQQMPLTIALSNIVAIAYSRDGEDNLISVTRIKPDGTVASVQANDKIEDVKAAIIGAGRGGAFRVINGAMDKDHLIQMDRVEVSQINLTGLANVHIGKKSITTLNAHDAVSAAVGCIGAKNIIEPFPEAPEARRLVRVFLGIGAPR